MTAVATPIPASTMSELMIKVIYPTSDAVLYVSSRTPSTEAEWTEISKHPYEGARIVSQIDGYQPIGEIILAHHERIDGKGYPRGIKGTAIPIAGRLVAIVDVYDALTARRLYRQPVSHEEAVQMIVAGRGTHFDPHVVDAFVRIAPSLATVGR